MRDASRDTHNIVLRFSQFRHIDDEDTPVWCKAGLSIPYIYSTVKLSNSKEQHPFFFAKDFFV